jgi:hypothetical protein
MTVPFIYYDNGKHLANQRLQAENRELQNKLSSINDIINGRSGGSIQGLPRKDDIVLADRLNKELILKGGNYEGIFIPVLYGVGFNLRANFPRYNDYRLSLLFRHQDFEGMKTNIVKVIKNTINDWEKIDKIRL